MFAYPRCTVRLYVVAVNVRLGCQAVAILGTAMHKQNGMELVFKLAEVQGMRIMVEPHNERL
jgi:hypothetical protein